MRPRSAGQILDPDLSRQELGTYQEDGRAAEGSLTQVVRLIHLNGPPGIGKSTIASAFADRHPGVLNLDIDRVAAMIGGWGDNFGDSFEAGRLLAAAMARVHLANGHDVIMPQMMTHVNARELADFESAAAAAKAEYVQILLTANVEPSVERCMERAKAGDPARMSSARSSTREAAGTSCGSSMHRSPNLQLTGSRTQLLTASGSQSNRPARPSKLHSGRLDPAYRPPQEQPGCQLGLDGKPAIDARPDVPDPCQNGASNGGLSGTLTGWELRAELGSGSQQWYPGQCWPGAWAAMALMAAAGRAENPVL